MLSICVRLNNESSESIRGVDSRTKKPRTNGSMYVVNFTLNGSMYTPFLVWSTDQTHRIPMGGEEGDVRPEGVVGSKNKDHFVSKTEVENDVADEKKFLTPT